MESASYGQLSRGNVKNQHGRRVWNVSCRDVGPLLEEYPRCAAELPRSEAYPQLGNTLGHATATAHAPNDLSDLGKMPARALHTKHSIHLKVSIVVTRNFWFTQPIEITAYLPFGDH